MMPALAREMARRDHDLVLGDARGGLADELSAAAGAFFLSRGISEPLAELESIRMTSG